MISLSPGLVAAEQVSSLAGCRGQLSTFPDWVEIDISTDTPSMY